MMWSKQLLLAGLTVLCTACAELPPSSPNGISSLAAPVAQRPNTSKGTTMKTPEEAINRQLAIGEAVAVAEKFMRDHGYAPTTSAGEAPNHPATPAELQVESHAWGARRIDNRWEVVFRFSNRQPPNDIYHLGADGKPERVGPSYLEEGGRIVAMTLDGSDVSLWPQDGLLSAFTRVRVDGGP